MQSDLHITTNNHLVLKNLDFGYHNHCTTLSHHARSGIGPYGCS